MKVVIVDGDVSYPPRSGKRLRTLHLMLNLAAKHQITYIGRMSARGVDGDAAKAYLRDRGIEPIFIDDPLPAKSGLLFPLRLAANLMSSLPYSVASHASRTMNAAVRQYSESNDVDLWQFEWLPYLATLMGCHTNAPKLVVAHNVDALIWKRYYASAAKNPQRWFLKQQWRKMARFERQAFVRADRVVAVSENDAQIIRTDYQMPNVDVVDNGIDRSFFASVSGRRRERSILFLGALDWRPNLDGLALLLEKIFPRVCEQVANAELHVVGRNPPPRLEQQIKRLSGARLHADVPDVRPFLAESAVMAVPLRVGGGSRLKILEALACGLPVVSTAIGAEGLHLQPGVHYVRAELSEMADALAQVLQNPDQSRAAADAGRELVLREYDWSVLAAKLEGVWERCIEQSRGPQSIDNSVAIGSS